MKKLITIFLLASAGLISVSSETAAIPAFARKYNMSCKTCHSPFPYLKAYGDEFAGNGFNLSDQEAPRYYVETGDPELSLIRDVPIAFRLEGYVTYNENKSKESDFTTPFLFKLLSGGAISKEISYYLYYILENGERGKIEDAWLMYNNLFGSSLDITVGQFQVCDPLFKRELRLTRDDYYIYKVKPGYSQADLTYDRGIMLAYGFESGTDIIFEIVNGSGIGEGSSGRFDNDTYKNLFGRLSQNIGEHFRIGAMGYWGKESESRFNRLNKIWMAGGDATLSVDPIELNFQLIKRNDDNPFLAPRTKEINTQGAFAELLIRPQGDDSKVYIAALFNWIESDQEDLNYKTLTGHTGYLLSRNIRLTAEVTYDLKLKYAKAGLGFVTAF